MTGPTFHVPDIDELPIAGDDDDGAAGGALGETGAPPDLTLIDGGGGSVTTAQVAGLVELPFAIVAIRRHAKHWKLSDEEADLIAEPLARMINRQAIAARAIRAAGDPLALSMALGLVISARLMEDADRADRTAPRRARGDAGAAAGSGDDARAGRLPDAIDHGAGVDAGRRDDGRPGGGSINGWGGFPGGSFDGAGPEAVPAEAASDVPRQALNF
jgi:hypothetical protein